VQKALFVGFEIETVVSRVVFSLHEEFQVCISRIDRDGMITDLKMRKRNEELQK